MIFIVDFYEKNQFCLVWKFPLHTNHTALKRRSRTDFLIEIKNWCYMLLYNDYSILQQICTSVLYRLFQHRFYKTYFIVVLLAQFIVSHFDNSYSIVYVDGLTRISLHSNLYYVQGGPKKSLWCDLEERVWEIFK